MAVHLPTPDVYLQLTWMLVGLIAFIVVLTFVGDHRRLQRFTFTAGFAGIVLLFLPFFPLLATKLMVRNFGSVCLA